MKEKILIFFKHDRSYEGGMKLYHEIGQRLSLKRQFNSYPESELKPILFEELRQMAGISPVEFQNIMKTKVHSVVVPPVPTVPDAPKTVKKPAAKKASSQKSVTKKPTAAKK